jgi:hypothetical protein
MDADKRRSAFIRVDPRRNFFVPFVIFFGKLLTSALFRR